MCHLLLFSRRFLGESSPLLVRRGGCAIKKKMRSHLSPRRRAGRSHRNLAREGPPRPLQQGGCCDIFLYVAATPPHEEGTTLAHLFAAITALLSLSLTGVMAFGS